MEGAAGVALAGVLQVATTHAKLTERHCPAVGLGTGGSRLQRHVRLEQHIRRRAVLRGAPAGHEVGAYLLCLLLQLIRDGQANGLDVLCMVNIQLAIDVDGGSHLTWLTLEGDAPVELQESYVMHDVAGVVLLMNQMLLNAHIHNWRGTFLLASLLPAILLRRDAVLAEPDLITMQMEIKIRMLPIWDSFTYRSF